MSVSVILSGCGNKECKESKETHVVEFKVKLIFIFSKITNCEKIGTFVNLYRKFTKRRRLKLAKEIVFLSKYVFYSEGEGCFCIFIFKM